MSRQASAAGGHMTLLILAALIEDEAHVHQLAFQAWRPLSVGRLLPQDLGYYADERAFCLHCRPSNLN